MSVWVWLSEGGCEWVDADAWHVVCECAGTGVSGCGVGGCGYGVVCVCAGVAVGGLLSIWVWTYRGVCVCVVGAWMCLRV